MPTTIEKRVVSKKPQLESLIEEVRRKNPKHFVSPTGGKKEFDKNWDKGWEKTGHP
jgi:hypothetical protein